MAKVVDHDLAIATTPVKTIIAMMVQIPQLLIEKEQQMTSCTCI